MSDKNPNRINNTYVTMWCPIFPFDMTLSISHTYTNNAGKLSSKSYMRPQAKGGYYFVVGSAVYITIKSKKDPTKPHTVMGYSKWYEFKREISNYLDTLLTSGVYDFLEDGTALINEANAINCEMSVVTGRDDPVELIMSPYLASTRQFTEDTQYDVSKGYPAVGFKMGENTGVCFLDDFISFVDYVKEFNLQAAVENGRLLTSINELRFVDNRRNGNNPQTNSVPVQQPSLPNNIRTRRNSVGNT